MDNDQRADLAQEALSNFGDDNGTASDLGDLLADLMHLCERDGIDFHQCLTTAEIHFNEEIQEEADGQ